ncbi:hypothetical protein [Variovorax sp. UMC13]|uniref:hypothetical protein n=1 Tax=Variovorax sp. UMC13 TaxID=1862326 RepID=UPI001600B09C|nr:hypothetical protein [Variovorax sp. UMC13]MBB1604385.1 hypothetical protein [Variovorax sp. UMC13]
MIVPAHWAEGRIQTVVDGRQLTVRRFGWSDDSPLAAQAHADERTREALARIQAGETLPRREAKTAYNGANGMPIREQIVRREGETLITRNGYGALCLNTPDVLFVDIDFEEAEAAPRRKGQGLPRLLAVVMAVLAAAAAAAITRSALSAAGVGAVVLSLLWWVPGRRQDKAENEPPPQAPATPEQRARQRIERFLFQHPDWHLRLYRTPAGLRVLAMHRTFSPGETAVADCFHELGADTVYARMCRNQNCFRARVSPKPWRIGIDDHLRPRPGVWPVALERMDEREAWVARYERAATGYASCTFVEAVGASAAVHPSAEAVQRLHDALSGAQSGLPAA